MKIGILTSFLGTAFVDSAIEACRELGVNYELVDLLSTDWISNVKNSDCDGFFCIPTCISQDKKNIQDERMFMISQVMKKPIYPDYLGLYIHECKRNMAAWLEIHGYPHVKTKVFTRRNEALEYLDTCQYPIVVKANVGAGAGKVRIIKNKRKAKRMCKRAFPINGNHKWLFLNAGLFYSTKIKGIPFIDLHSPQKDYFFVQEYKPIKCEWRILKVGDSYFGHQKLLKGQYASGSGLVGWVAPPKELLLLAKDICDKGNFSCMDVDVFETIEGEYYINELQAFFGSYLDYQMKIDGKPGRYKYVDGEFVFEEGEFNVYNSNKLKIENFIKILSTRQ